MLTRNHVFSSTSRGRRLGTILIGLTVASVVSACGGSNADDGNGGANGGGEEATLRIGGPAPEGDIRYKAVECMEESLPEATDGQVTVEFLAGTIGGETEILERLSLGTLEGYIGSTGPFASMTGEPLAGIYETPYLFDDWDHLYSVATNDIGQDVEEAIAASTGIEILDYVSMGNRAVYAKGVDLSDPAAYRGLKVRTLESDVHQAMYEALGAAPVPMAWDEVYTSLQTGVLDVVDGSLSSGLGSNHQELVDRVTYLGNAIVINSAIAVAQPWLNDLPEGQQEAVRTVVAECAEFERAENDAYQAELESKWKDAGVEFVEVDREKFASIVQPAVYPKLEQQLPDGLLEKIQALGN